MTLTALPVGTLTRCPIQRDAERAISDVTILQPLEYYSCSGTGRWISVGTRAFPGAARFHPALLDDSLLDAAGCRVRDDGLVVLEVAS